MKAFVKFTFALSAFAFLFSSCSKSNEAGKMVPKNALFVAQINTQSLTSKLSWNDIMQTDWYKEANSYSENKEWLKRVLENPDSSGIDFKKGLVFFAEKNTSNNVYLVLEGSIKNEKDFEWFNKNFDTSQAVRKMDKVNLLTLKGKGVVGWDDRHFAYVASPDGHFSFNQYNQEGATNHPEQDDIEEISKYCSNLFNLKSDSSLGKNEKFANLLKENGDIHFWQNTEEIMKNSNSTGMLGMVKLDAFFKNNVSTYTVNFDKGKIVINQKGYGSKELMDILEKYKGSNINADMIKNIPSQNVFGVFAMNFKPEGLMELIKLSGTDGFINTFTPQLGFSLGDFVKATNGNLLLAFSDLKLKKDTPVLTGFHFPGFHYIFSTGIGDKASLQKLIDAGKKISTQMGMDTLIKYASNDKTFALSNSGAFADQFVAGNNNKFDFINKISGHPIGLYIDLHKILEEIAPSVTGKDDAKTAIELSLNTWNNITMTGGDFKDNAFTANTEINLVDQNTNSLKQLNHFMNEMFKIVKTKKNNGLHENRLDSLLVPPPIDTVKVK